MNRLTMTSRFIFLLAIGTVLAPEICPANTLNYNGLPHTSLGAATLAPAGPNLLVSNIGSSGLDGVSVDIDPSALYTMDWLPLDAGNITPLSADLVKIAIDGRMGGGVQALGDSTLMRDAGGAKYEIIADYSAAGSPTFRVQLFLGGGLVFSQAALAQPLIVAGDGSALPSGAAAGLPASLGSPDPGFVWKLAAGQAVTIPAGPTVLADEIRLLADAPTAPFTSLADFSLFVRDMPQGLVTITGSASRPVPEPVSLVILAAGLPVFLRRRKRRI